MPRCNSHYPHPRQQQWAPPLPSEISAILTDGILIQHQQQSWAIMDKKTSPELGDSSNTKHWITGDYINVFVTRKFHAAAHCCQLKYALWIPNVRLSHNYLGEETNCLLIIPLKCHYKNYIYFSEIAVKMWYIPWLIYTKKKLIYFILFHIFDFTKV